MQGELIFYVNERAGGRMPSRQHAGDAGYDLYTSERAVIRPGEFQDVRTAVSVALPPGMWANLVGRSSTWRHKNLRVETGVIDNGYRGELFLGVHNPGRMTQIVEKGDRLGQLILMPLTHAPARIVGEREFQRFNETHPTDRGHNGFGSTGK